MLGSAGGTKEARACSSTGPRGVASPLVGVFGLAAAEYSREEPYLFRDLDHIAQSDPPAAAATLQGGHVAVRPGNFNAFWQPGGIFRRPKTRGEGSHTSPVDAPVRGRHGARRRRREAAERGRGPLDADRCCQCASSLAADRPVRGPHVGERAVEYETRTARDVVGPRAGRTGPAHLPWSDGVGVAWDEAAAETLPRAPPAPCCAQQPARPQLRIHGSAGWARQ